MKDKLKAKDFLNNEPGHIVNSVIILESLEQYKDWYYNVWCKRS